MIFSETFISNIDIQSKFGFFMKKYDGTEIDFEKLEESIINKNDE